MAKEIDEQTQACVALWAAVFNSALEDAGGTDQDEARRAMAWFNSDAKGIGSFLWVCTLFDLNADAVREFIPSAIVRMKARDKRKRS